MAVTVERVWSELDAGLRGFIRGRVRNPAYVEDILQDVYLKIHARVDSLEDEEKIRSWVYQIARNAIADHYRGQHGTAEMVELAYTPDDPAEEEVAEALSASVRHMLEYLSPEHREALILTEYQGMSQVELAKHLGISVPGAKSRVQRARRRLKTLLLACCHFELDRTGRIINYEPRSACCSTCSATTDR